MDNMNEQFYQQQTTRRYTRAEIYQAIELYCYQSTGVAVTSVVKIEDNPTQLRHSCFATGVTNLPQYSWQVPSEFGAINVPYYFCSKCGKLFVYKHIYD